MFVTLFTNYDLHTKYDLSFKTQIIFLDILYNAISYFSCMS
jgi:hypothetical protein